jgi:hypothetical protein
LSLLSFLCHNRSSGNGFKRMTFLYLWPPALCLCLSCRNTLLNNSFLKSEVTLRLKVGQSVSTSWCRAHCGTWNQTLILSEICCLVSVGRPLWREVGSISCQSLSVVRVFVHCQVFCFSFFNFTCYTFFMYIQYIQGLCQSRSCPIICSLRYNSSIHTWTYSVCNQFACHSINIIQNKTLHVYCTLWNRSVWQALIRILLLIRVGWLTFGHSVYIT